MVAGIALFFCNSIAALSFYIASKPDYQSVRPLNLILLEALKQTTTMGFHYLNFGVSTSRIPGRAQVVNWSLFRFKEGFASGDILRKSFTKKLG